MCLQSYLLFLVPWFRANLSGSDGLACNTAVESLDLSCLLRWDCPHASPNISYSVQTKTQGDPWQDVPWCVWISTQSCDVSPVFSNFELYNMIRVGVHFSPSSTTWMKPLKFDYSDFTFSSPSVSVSWKHERLAVKVQFPCSANRRCSEEGCCPVTKLIDPWTTVTVYNQHNSSDQQMNAKLRPSFAQIVVELERIQAERKQKDEPPVKILSPAIDYSRRRSLHFFPDSHLSRSKSDMLHNLDTFPGPQAPPARVNPFSQREDLKGGKIKLFDTPSKSVISLTFTLPPPPYCDDIPAADAEETEKSRGHRRCHSLPCTPPPHLTSAPNSVFTEELTFETDTLKDTSEGEGRSRAAGDSGLPLSLDSPSLNLLDAKEEREEEPMDCSSSPDTQDASSPYSKPPTPPSQSSTPFQPFTPPLSNGWGSAVSNGPPCLPPLPSLDNHNIVVSRPLGWTAAAKSPNNNGYHSPPSDPAGSSLFGSGSGHSLDQEEVISCPGCCLAGFRFPSLCLRAPPRRNPYKNLNGDHAPSRRLLCPGPKGMPPSPTPTTTTSKLEPGLALPGAKT